MIGTVEALAAAGWHVKLMSDHESRPGVCWRVWLRWPRGKLPHKEESARVDTLDGAADWLDETAQAWRFE